MRVIVRVPRAPLGRVQSVATRPEFAWGALIPATDAALEATALLWIDDNSNEPRTPPSRAKEGLYVATMATRILAAAAA